MKHLGPFIPSICIVFRQSSRIVKQSRAPVREIPFKCPSCESPIDSEARDAAVANEDPNMKLRNELRSAYLPAGDGAGLIHAVGSSRSVRGRQAAERSEKQTWT